MCRFFVRRSASAIHGEASTYKDGNDVQHIDAKHGDTHPSFEGVEPNDH